MGKFSEKIITTFWAKPGPSRNFDWCAYRDGYEEDGGYGYGTTEAEALADLARIEAEEIDYLEEMDLRARAGAGDHDALAALIERFT